MQAEDTHECESCSFWWGAQCHDNSGQCSILARVEEGYTEEYTPVWAVYLGR